AGVAVHTASDMAAAAATVEKIFVGGFIDNSSFQDGWRFGEPGRSDLRFARVGCWQGRRCAQGMSAKSAARMRSISLVCPIHRLPLRSKPRPAVILPKDKPDATGEIVWVPTLRRLTVPTD